ncbi:MAG: M50 family metallopeptidase [Pirellulales bacterium]
MVHEAGHIVGAWLTGGEVATLVLHPLTISRTDLAINPRPLVVVWAGPVAGALLPLATWGIAAWREMPGAFALRFFAGFCLVANGAYIAGGSFGAIGDCGEMLAHGSPVWTLWLFGALTIPLGFWLWHGQGPHFGLGNAKGRVSRGAAYSSLAACLVLVVIGLLVGGR